MPYNQVEEGSTFGGDEVQRFVDVSDLVEAHLAAVGLGQGLARDDFQQQHQLQAIAEVVFDVLDAGAGLPQVTVAPCCEGLQRTKTFIYWKEVTEAG